MPNNLYWRLHIFASPMDSALGDCLVRLNGSVGPDDDMIYHMHCKYLFQISQANSLYALA